MSTVVCRQAVQPSVDSCHVVEATTVRLKLVQPECHDRKTHFQGWSLLQSLYSQKPKHDSDQQTSYVHPLVNQSSLPKLSQKSLELCTESLGSETGSDTSEADAILSVPMSGLPAAYTRSRRDQVESKRASTAARSFPPPLTTISGSKPFRVLPHREGGRLIIEAMEAPEGNSCFQAERAEGRLRLTYWSSGEGCDETGGLENDTSDAEEAEEEEMERTVFDVEKFQRPRRCKEDGHGDKGICCNWEPCWVATS